MIEKKTEVPNARPLTYDEHCKRLDALAWPGMEALDNGDKDAALLYIAAMVDYLLRYGEEMRVGAPPVDQIKLQEIKRTFRPILQAIEQRLGPRPPSLRLSEAGKAWSEEWPS